MTGKDRRLSPGWGWAVAAVATLAMSVSYIDRQTLAALAPTVRTSLGINHLEYGWLTSAFSMAYLVAAPLAGLAIDRVGARRGLVAALLVWSVVSASHALVPSFAVLFALRIALGAAEAPSFPGAAQAVRRALPPHHRSAGFGLLFTGSSIGAMIAAPLAIRLNAGIGWRLAFIGTAIVGVSWIPLWLLVTHFSPAALGPGPIAPIAPRPWALLREPAVVRAVVAVLASAPGLMFVLNWYPQYLVEARGLTQGDLGRYLWFPPLLFDLGAVAFGVLASRRERGGAAPHRSHVELFAVAGLLAATLTFVPLVGTARNAVLLAGIAMAGGGGMYALATADMMSRVHPARISAAGGITAAAQSLAHIVANPLLGREIDRSHDYTRVLYVLGALAIPGAIAWVLWPMRSPRRAEV